MSYRSLINCNRVFRDPGNITISTSLTVSIPLIGQISTISLDDTNDYCQSGYVSIGGESFYYTGKTVSPPTLTGVTRAVNGTQSGHSIGSIVIQERPAPQGVSLTNSNLSGWYIDGKTNQASLRVYDSPVIQKGVIRFNDDLGIFQGCVATTPSIIWQEFNATEGPQGEPGIINAILTFDNVSDPGTLTTNIGEIIKTTTINTLDDPVPPVEVRTIVSGNVSINGLQTDTLAITQTANELVCMPQPLPFTWDMNNTITGLKGWDIVNQQAYSWATTTKFPVEAGNLPIAGQVVVSYVSLPGNQLCVKPLVFTNAATDLNPLKVLSPFPPSIAIVGICINNPTVDTPAIVATSGITQVQITNDVTPYQPTSASKNIDYCGKICIANGFGFGINVTSAIVPPYVQIGTFLEQGDITASGNAIVRLDPRIIQ
jgi:hypothetical protein